MKKLVIIAITILFFSCGSHKHTPEKEVRKSRNEIVSQINPFKLSVSDSITFTDLGDVKPIHLNINYKDLFEGVVEVKDGVVDFTMENKDTLKLDRLIETTVETKETDVVTVEKKKPLPKILWWSIGINVVIVALFVLRTVSRAYRPI